MAKTTGNLWGFGGNGGGGTGLLGGIYSGIFGGHPNSPQYNTVPLAQPYINQADQTTMGLQNTLDTAGQTMLNQAMPGTKENQQLWDLTSNRYLNAMTPKLAGAGVLTSGPGMQGMSQGLQDLSTQFTADNMKQLQNAFQQYMAGGTDIGKLFGSLGGIQMGAPSTTTASAPGLWQDIFGSGGLGGGSGASSLMGAMGSGTSSGGGLMGLF